MVQLELQLHTPRAGAAGSIGYERDSLLPRILPLSALHRKRHHDVLGVSALACRWPDRSDSERGKPSSANPRPGFRDKTGGQPAFQQYAPSGKPWQSVIRSSIVCMEDLSNHPSGSQACLWLLGTTKFHPPWLLGLAAASVAG